MTDRGDGSGGGAARKAYATQIARVAAWSPARPAVDDVDDGRTFGALHQRACQLAHALLVKVVPAGSTIGVLAPLRPETIEVVLATAIIDARTLILEPGIGPDLLEARCRAADVVGLVVAADLLASAAPAIARLERLNFAFVLDGTASRRDGPPVTLPGASPYEPTLGAYPTEAPEPDGPRLRRIRPHEPPALTLPDPAPTLPLGADDAHRSGSAHPLDPTWGIDPEAVLACLAMGGRLRLSPR